MSPGLSLFEAQTVLSVKHKCDTAVHKQKKREKEKN